MYTLSIYSYNIKKPTFFFGIQYKGEIINLYLCLFKSICGIILSLKLTFKKISDYFINKILKCLCMPNNMKTMVMVPDTLCCTMLVDF